MSNVKFSIVIPCKERAGTLHYTLLTCLAQKFDSYEIIVCDNFSSPAVKRVVDELGSPKIRYIRAPQRLAMSDNWELALSHAEGEYVIVIGDDDGLLLHALPCINRIIEVTGTEALRWERLYYSWPSLPIKEEANYLIIPLASESSILKSQQVLPLIANNLMDYTMLPMLYNSAIHRDLISVLKNKTGRVFRAASPDIYSGFALAYLAQSYVSVGVPMSINAGSASSNGVANLALGSDSPVAQEFHTLNAQSGMVPHPEVPDVRALSTAIADAFQYAKEALFPNDNHIRLDRKKLILSLCQASPLIESDLQAIRRSICDDSSLSQWFDSSMKQHLSLQSATQVPAVKSRKSGFDGHNLRFDATEFNVHDVLGVARIYEKMSDWTPDNIEVVARQMTIGQVTGNTKKYLPRRVRAAARMLLRGH